MDQAVNPHWQDLLKAVAAFHDAFEIGNAASPQAIDKEEAVLRYRLMREENEEYLDAAFNADLQGIADALGDQLYVLCGTMLRHGLQELMAEVFFEIHRSNMSKLDEQGKPIFRQDGKVLKSASYAPPNLSNILPNSHDALRR